MSTTDISRRSFVARSGAVAFAATTFSALLADAAQAELPTTGLPAPADVTALGRPIEDLDVLELASLLQHGDLTSVAVTQRFLDRIAAFNGPTGTYADAGPGALGAFVRVDAAGALADAADADARLAAALAGGELAPLLCGVPFAVQEAIAIEGLPLQNGTTALAGNVALRDAGVVDRLRELGAVPVGLTACAPFSQLTAGQPTGAYARNPWKPSTRAGGPGEGAAVAAAARLIPAALAVDGGGGATVPAAITGASAIVPSEGLVPTDGLIPDVPGKDVIAPVARSVRGASLILNAILGPRLARDPVSATAPADFPLIPIVPRTTDHPLEGTTIGVPTKDWMRTASGLDASSAPRASWDAGYAAAFDRFVDELRALGATVKEFDGLDLTDTTANPYRGSTDVVGTSAGVSLTPEQATTLAVRDEVRYTVAIQGFSGSAPSGQAADLLAYYGRSPSGGGAATLAAAVAIERGLTWGARLDAEERRRTLARNSRDALAEAGVDMMLVLTVAGPLGPVGSDFPARRDALDLPNVLGWPAVTLPIGTAADVPVSATLIGPRFSEPAVVQTAIDYQAAHPQWHTMKAPDPAA